jgi:DNA-binding NarL/FixJ family response regulator
MKKKNVLTKPEISIIQLAANGLDNDEIGRKLFISKHTVKAHIAAILKKMNCNNRTQAVYVATKNKWIE